MGSTVREVLQGLVGDEHLDAAAQALTQVLDRRRSALEESRRSIDDQIKDVDRKIEELEKDFGRVAPAGAEEGEKSPKGGKGKRREGPAKRKAGAASFGAAVDAGAGAGKPKVRASGQATLTVAAALEKLGKGSAKEIAAAVAEQVSYDMTLYCLRKGLAFGWAKKLESGLYEFVKKD